MRPALLTLLYRKQARSSASRYNNSIYRWYVPSQVPNQKKRESIIKRVCTVLPKSDSLVSVDEYSYVERKKEGGVAIR